MVGVKDGGDELTFAKDREGGEIDDVEGGVKEALGGVEGGAKGGVNGGVKGGVKGALERLRPRIENVFDSGSQRRKMSCEERARSQRLWLRRGITGRG